VEKSIYKKIFLVSLLSFAFLCAFFSSPQKANSAPAGAPPDTRLRSDYDTKNANGNDDNNGIFKDGPSCNYGIWIDYTKHKTKDDPPILTIAKADPGFGNDPKSHDPYPGWDPKTWKFKLVEATQYRGKLIADDNYYYFQCDSGSCERMAIQINAHNDWLGIIDQGVASNIYALWRQDATLPWAEVANDLDTHQIRADFCVKDMKTTNVTRFIEWAQDNDIDGDIDQSKVPNVSSYSGPIADAINQAIRHVLNGISSVLDSIGQWLIDKLLIVDLRSDPSTAAAVSLAWSKVRDLSNVLLILGLLFIAVANAIRFQIDYYTAKMLLPRLIIAAIFINFSHLMTMAILDVANVLTHQISHDIDFLALIVPQTMLSANIAGAGVSLSYFILALVASISGASLAIAFLSIFALTVVGIAIATLIVMLIVRMMVIYLLVVFSPLVFLFSVLPFTRGLTSTWWNYLARWVFMGPVIALILFVASQL